MDNILTQICSELVENLLLELSEGETFILGQRSERLLSVAKEGIRQLLGAAAELTDHTVLQAKKDRKIDGFTVHQKKVPRSVETSVGTVTYRRTYFRTKDGTYLYLTDHLIGVERMERVTKELCAKLLGNSAYVSMQTALDMENCSLTRQTVDNKLLAMKEVAFDMERMEHTPEVLYLFADEDHVSLRPKHSTCVPCVTVTEGIDTSDPKRHRTIHPIHFQGYGQEPDAFAENILCALYERYDMKQVKRIVVHSDGGNWIRTLVDILPNSIHVMDGFHLEKHLKSLWRFPGAKKYASAIRAAIKGDDFEGFVRSCAKISDELDEKRLSDFKDQVNYFQNRWESIVAHASGNYGGSCTEALISHVLSDRLSRDPISWSRAGLARMAQLRVFALNGGKVTGNDIRVSRNRDEQQQDLARLQGGLEKYNRYAKKQMDEVVKNKHDWSIFDKKLREAAELYTKRTGTSILMKACGRILTIV